ncbi:CD109 antigen-like isoform X10 [Dreissena polymorpha]|uniref:CD109 antigen-like isoform X6 n=1 Tax=Dreissena polymorpha TaxID=45954 RepID=UPI002264B753|nr:CD109 antigen-like isoform X6 [Dreissena polymorpha]XP_052258343.1 CD109 antigen-like isoform X7 [Dreissena polymorpha]XP_052258344.1 CD109 antigen-like isoform X8 [Dreissena polymorpha]XP_052258345.1 CD109 antigen-like isoform X9 [Dreissena polymorpha]XP_052258346.1 CD109 antigen-like isoform X10 [Dreissena polymorpha]
MDQQTTCCRPGSRLLGLSAIFITLLTLNLPSPTLGTYYVSFPRSFVSGSPVDLYIQVTEATSPVNVVAAIVDGNRMVVSSAIKAILSGKPERIQIDVPDDLPTSRYVIAVNGTGGLSFYNEANLTYINDVIVMIQTDKTRYSAGQTVRYRAIFLQPDLTNFEGNASISIYDGKNNRIQLEGPHRVLNGVIEGQLNLSREPIYGDWKIQANVLDSVKNKSFKVFDYVLPRFNVELIIPSDILTTDQTIRIAVKSSFTFNTGVQGSCTLVVYQENDRYHYYSISTPINGLANFTISMSDLRSQGVDTSHNMKLRATVTDNSTLLSFTTEKDIIIQGNHDDQYKLQEIMIRNGFVNGLNYTTYLKLTKNGKGPNMIGALDVSVTYYSVVLSTCHQQYGTLDHQYLQISTSNFNGQTTFGQNGIAVVTFPVNGINIEKVDLQVRYTTAADFSKTLYSMSKTPTDVLKVTLSSAEMQVGNVVTVTAESSKPLYGPVTSEVYCRNRLVQFESTIANGETTFRWKVLLTNDMVPFSYIVASHITSGRWSLSDSAFVQVDGTPMKNKVQVTYNTSLTEPGQFVDMKITADPLSMVYVMVGDERNRLLGNEKDIFSDEVMDGVTSFSNNHADNGYLNGQDESTTGLITLTDGSVFNTNHADQLFILGSLPTSCQQAGYGGTMTGGTITGGTMSGSLNGQTGTCLDKIPNCAAYAADLCTTASYRLWATYNCADHCNLCAGGTMSGSLNGQTGTCLDKIPNCAAYAAEVCTTASYRLWATDNCADHCNLCAGGTITGTGGTMTGGTMTGTGGTMTGGTMSGSLNGHTGTCLDTISNCATYAADLCTITEFKAWVWENCAGHCNLCAGGAMTGTGGTMTGGTMTGFGGTMTGTGIGMSEFGSGGTMTGTGGTMTGTGGTITGTGGTITGTGGTMTGTGGTMTGSGGTMTGTGGASTGSLAWGATGSVAGSVLSGGSMRPALDALQIGQLLRDKFPETWIWEKHIVGVSGELHITKQLPDSITSWNTTVFATNYATGFGIADNISKVTVKKSFFITMDLPDTIVQGEECLLQITVFNYLPERQEVVISVQHSDDIHQTIPTATVVQPNEGHSTFVRLTPNITGDVNITVRAKAGDFFTTVAYDSLQKTLRVRPNGVHMTENQQHLIHVHPTSSNYNKSVSLAKPNNIVPGTERLIHLKITGDFMVPSIDGLQNLINRPSGCGEQNMVNFAPDVFISKYLKTVNKFTPLLKKTVIEHLEFGYQNELRNKHSDGSFSAFGNSDRSGSTWLTAFVMKCFGLARSMIMIDDNIIKEGINWLLDKQKTDGSFDEPGRVIHTNMQSGTGHGAALTAFIMISLLENRDSYSAAQSRMNTSALKSMAYLETQLSTIHDAYTLAITCYGLVLTRSSQSSMCFTKLQAASSIDGELTYWTSGGRVKRSGVLHTRAPAQDIESTAYALLTYIEMNKMAEAFSIVKWLVSQRNPSGGFQSTQDTVVSLQALARFSELSTIGPHQTPNYNVHFVGIGNGFNHQYDVTLGNYDVTHTVPIPDSLDSLSISATGHGVAVVDVIMSYYVQGSTSSNFIEVTAPVSSESINSVTIDPCVRWIGPTASGMILVEIEMITGFRHNVDVLGSQPKIKRYEANGKSLALYFDALDTGNQHCVKVTMERSDPVVKSQACHVVAYDYYEPTHQAVTVYESGILKRSTVCDICPLCTWCHGAHQSVIVG